ncbi:MAG: hypothetical protein K9G60_03505, partial [Pseudolabrys sp.]|nr:hypothetical protein [Pseudolabrys sp.]
MGAGDAAGLKDIILGKRFPAQFIESLKIVIVRVICASNRSPDGAQRNPSFSCMIGQPRISL